VIRSNAQPATAEATPKHLGRRLARGTVLDLAVGGVVLGVYLVVQLVLLLGPRPLDPARYFDAAVDFPDIPVDLWTLRIGLIAPVRLAVLVFGPSEASYYAVPIAVGLVLTAAVYGTMLLLFRDRVLAAAAALVTVLNAPFLFTSSYIYPDTSATATFTAGFFFLVLAAVRAERDDPGWVPAAATASAGVLFGWSYLIREFSPFLLPAVAVAVVLLRLPLRRVAILAGAAVVTAGLELVYGLIRYDEPFIHVRQLLDRNHSEFSRPRAVRIEHIQAQLDNVFDSLLVGPRLLLAWDSGWLLLLVVAIFLVSLVLVHDRRLLLFAAWFFSFWAIMVGIGLGELPSGRWILNVTNVRYWYPALPPLVMGAFAGLWLLVQKWSPGRRGVLLAQVAAALLAVVVVTPGVAEFRNCAAQQAWWNDPSKRWTELRSWLATPDAQRFGTISTDWMSERLAQAYVASTFGNRVWEGDVESFALARPIRPASPLETSLVLVHKDRLLPFSQSRKRLQELRSDWTPVFSTTDRRMVVLAHVSAGVRTREPAERGWWRLGAPAARSNPGACGRSPYEAGGG
jgi:hypothetical protein